MTNVTVQEALKAAIEAIEMASEDAKEWATQYVTSDNAPTTVRQYVADKAEPALNQLKSALSDIEKREPVAYNHHFIYDDDFMPEEVLSHSKEIPAVSGMKYAGKTDELYTSPISKELVGLSDSAWMNIVNHDHAYENMSKEDAVHYAVKATEAKLKQLNAEKG